MLNPINRWYGTDSYHLSGFGGLKRGENNGDAQLVAYIQQRASRGEIPLGDIPLQPGWKTDYRQLVASYIATLAAQESEGERRWQQTQN